MKLAIIGTGYVGLVTGTCFAETGNDVICVDNDQKKIDMLKEGKIPIWEPGLEPMVQRNFDAGRLNFTSNIKNAVEKSDVCFIAVGTPPGEDGSADLRYVLAVASDIGKYMNSYKVVVDKSTVPVGTADKVKETIQKELDKRDLSYSFDVVSNPEFLKEGAAIPDFMKPDRVVIGSESEISTRIMKDLYTPFNRIRDKIIIMKIRSAEMTKYAANAMLATKISFINEIANLCEKVGADVSDVRRGIGSDSRIGYQFIYPGIGYGGSCFPKDVKALIKMEEEQGLDPKILNSVEEINKNQKSVIVKKVVNRFGEDLSGLTFAIWGLAFKPKTDDMREAPSIVIINELIKRGAKINAYDPVAISTAKEIFNSDKITYFDKNYPPTENADALILVTEWPEFRDPDFDKLKSSLKNPLIFDGRNQYNPVELKEMGFEYYSIGRS